MKENNKKTSRRVAIAISIILLALVFAIAIIFILQALPGSSGVKISLGSEGAITSLILRTLIITAALAGTSFLTTLLLYKYDEDQKAKTE